MQSPALHHVSCIVVKTPQFAERGKFATNLKRAGLTRRQIQHVARLYGAGNDKAASAYLRDKGVSYRRRRTTARTAPPPLRRPIDVVESLYDRARAAKRAKLGTDKYTQFANDAELREIIERDIAYLKRRAGERRTDNPFWYHQGSRPYPYTAKR